MVHRWAPAALWRALHPLVRARFAEQGAVAPLPRQRLDTQHGGHIEVHTIPVRPGASGEPVLLLAPLGARVECFTYGAGATLASRLVEAGFAVSLLAHRLGGGEGQAPPGAVPTFEDAACIDVARAVAHVVEVSGYPRVHVVGHGLGGQLALAWAAHHRGAGLASLAVMGASVQPGSGSAQQRRWVAAMGRLPGGWQVPTQALARWWAPLSGAAAGAARRRGALAHAMQDVPLSALLQQAACVAHAGLVDTQGVMDFREGLSAVQAPLWVASGEGDAWAPPAAVEAVRDHWRGGRVHLQRAPEDFSHLDLILHPEAGTALHAPLVQWLVTHRVRAWREDVWEVGARTRR